jgi:poly(A) polymerase
MPVITPAYPSMCATFNITRSSKTIINRELKRALQISESIMVGTRPWSDLFVKHSFFTTGYKYYISVVSAAKTKESHTIWSGYVESKVRMLVQKLEQHQSIALAHPFNKGYERQHRCQNEKEIESVQEGSLDFLYKGDAAEPTIIKIEPAVAELPIKTENGEDDKPIKAENGENGMTVKSETAEDNGPITAEPIKSETPNDSKPSETPAVSGATDVYTTTHYIGLELAAGKYCPRHDSDSSAAIRRYPTLTLQAPNHLIYLIRLKNSKNSAPLGKSTRMI